MALALLAGCQNADPSKRTVVLEDLEHASIVNGLWQSAEWDTPWLSFPAKQAVTVEHALGVAPRLVQVYVSFSSDDCDRDVDTTALLASGTLARISSVNAESVTVRNDTQEAYCLRLVLQ
jgi:hypothetical protein